MKRELNNRRNFLKLCGLVGTSLLLGDSMFADQTSTVDHLVLGVSDLNHGMDWAEKNLGIRPAIGGVHPGVGTRNALLSLGHKQYLEIIAPDPNQSEFNFHLDMRKFPEPRLITWGASTNDIDSIAKKAKEGSFEIIGPRDGSRKRPDGKILKWKTAVITKSFGDQTVEPMPFFIQWSADSLHPSEDSPKGCELLSFEIEHPQTGELTDALKNFGIDIRVKEAKSIRLIANLKTLKGNIALS